MDTEISINNMDDKLIIFKITYNGFKIGNLNLVKKKNDTDKIKLADIIVLNRYRNLGIGSKLLENAIAYTKSIGINKIYGSMIGDISRLEKFYRSLGFKISGKNIELDVNITPTTPL